MPTKTTRKTAKKKRPTAGGVKTAVEAAVARAAPVADKPAAPGIVCPRCGCRDLRAMDGRPWEVTKNERRHGFIRRRRRCRHCGKVIYTRETIETDG